MLKPEFSGHCAINLQFIDEGANAEIVELNDAHISYICDLVDK